MIEMLSREPGVKGKGSIKGGEAAQAPTLAKISKRSMKFLFCPPHMLPVNEGRQQKYRKGGWNFGKEGTLVSGKHR